MLLDGSDGSLRLIMISETIVSSFMEIKLDLQRKRGKRERLLANLA